VRKFLKLRVLRHRILSAWSQHGDFQTIFLVSFGMEKQMACYP